MVCEGTVRGEIPVRDRPKRKNERWRETTNERHGQRKRKPEGERKRDRHRWGEGGKEMHDARIDWEFKVV
jgi:hypothetical protein